MGKSNNFKKEYVTGRKDQYDLDYTIFRKCVEETDTREELIQLLEERMKYVISKMYVTYLSNLISDARSRFGSG